MIKSSYASVPVYRIVRIIKTLEKNPIPNTASDIAVLKKSIEYDEPLHSTG